MQKVEVQKPFPQEEELKTKTERLNELNALLNLDKRKMKSLTVSVARKKHSALRMTESDKNNLHICSGGHLSIQ